MTVAIQETGTQSELEVTHWLGDLEKLRVSRLNDCGTLEISMEGPAPGRMIFTLDSNEAHALARWLKEQYLG